MRLFPRLLGLLSAALGALIPTPDDERLRPLQIAVNELSWIPGLLGLFAVMLGLTQKPRAWVAVISGMIGAGLAATPFLNYKAAADDMESAMRAGLGQVYPLKIPTAVWSRLASSPWSLDAALGGRRRNAPCRVTHDVVYAAPGGHSLKLDVYQPLTPAVAEDHYPAVIAIHGGGWRHGDRGGWFSAHNRYFASQGYVVFDIQYRLSDVARWPAQLDDVQTAIRWVKNHADEYQIDPARLALMGRSAGGHLALMAAYCQGDDTQVQSVISIYGPTELRFKNLSPQSAIIPLIGGRYEDMPDAYDSASPVNFVRDGLPPTLLIEGGMDTLVPHTHGDALTNRLSLTNTPFALLRIPWSRHGFDAVLPGLGTQLVLYHVEWFLAWSLYRGRNDA